MTVWVAVSTALLADSPYIASILGVFPTEAEAVAVCTEPRDMVGPVLLGEIVAQDRPWPGAYYPAIKRKMERA